MEYNYNTPEEAIISLEKAYTDMDIVNIIASKDFVAEAKLILQRSNMSSTKEIIKETAELLKLSLIEDLKNNGYPSFKDVKREFSTIKEINENLFFLEESLLYDNGESYKNKVFLTNENNKWRVAMTE